jgi:hypothetical protein
MENTNINDGNMFQAGSIYKNLTVDGKALPDSGDWTEPTK